MAYSPVARAAEPSTVLSGAAIYRNQCAECHGPKGEGVEGEYDEPLYGDRTVAKLAKLIHKTMPEDEPELCVDADAERVARYIHGAFYSEEARARNRPARVELARLTAGQFEQSVASLVAGFRTNSSAVGEARGLSADYYDDRRPNRKKRRIERVDPEIRFQFGEKSPDPEKIEAEAFAIQWRGALLVETTGEYEFCVRTENGFNLYVNENSDKATIDGWVSSGELREHRTSLKLLGGHAYPIRLEYFKYKEKSASIELRWTPPGGVESVIPLSSLAPVRVAPVMVVTTPFPPDDRSMGYERGTAVSKAWHESTTAAAVEVADHVATHLEDLAGGDPRKDAEAYREAARAFSRRLVERAFRRPLSEEERGFYVDDRFEGGIKPEIAVKRVVILALTSPRFLYPELLGSGGDAHGVVSRLALGLRDTLPTEALRRVAQEGRLRDGDRDQVRSLAREMLDHPQTRLKLRGFFDHWLHLDDEHDLAKDPDLYPNFDRRTMADFRRSLNLFIDDIVWSEASDYRELLLADHLYLNGRLADFLGHGTFDDGRFRKVSFDPRARAGVLTHPYLLARFAYHRSTSPIHRGVFVTRNVLGRSLKPPPEAVQFEESRFDPDLTMREKVTEMTKAESCMSCHSMINPLGFSLEHFDAVGRFRFAEKEREIDAASEFQTHGGTAIAIRGARDVARHAATSVMAQRGFIQHLFEHLIKQPVNAYGPETLDQLHKAFVSQDYHIQNLVVEIVTLAALHQYQPTELRDHEHEKAES